MLILDHGRKQHDTGQWEEAQPQSKVMMIVHLHKGEAGLPSRKFYKLSENGLGRRERRYMHHLLKWVLFGKRCHSKIF
jgi:hypothetical protein